MKSQKYFVLDLDGMPFTFLKNKFSKNEMPNLKRICEATNIKRINSVYPTISSVAWTSFATGKNPAQHGIFGFVDRKNDPFSIFIPTSRDRKTDTIWAKLSSMGKKVIVVNVPITYPPDSVNGIMVSCFLCTDIKKATFPKEFSEYLERKQYIIDVDARLAVEDKHAFMNELSMVMQKRFEVCFELMEREEWDFFQLHIMETDRLFHFMWEYVISENITCYSPAINNFFKKLDYYIGEVYKRLPTDTGLIILSDHGFCGIKYEVQINKWLECEGFLKFQEGKEKQLKNYSKESICYSLIPGRIYINLEGREEKGSVKKSEYTTVRHMLKERLLAMTDLDNNRIIDRVYYKEDIYEGDFMENAADLIAHPVNGYDLKGRLDCNEVLGRSHITGMHTFDDAIIAGVGVDISEVNSISDVSKIILKEMGYEHT